MRIEINPGENLTIKLGERGSLVIHWVETLQDGEFRLTEDCQIAVFSQPDTGLSHQKLSNKMNPEGFVEVNLTYKET